jgi:hypothetical protein
MTATWPRPLCVNRGDRFGDVVAPPEDQLRFILIVAPAPERDVLDRGGSAVRIRLDVVELQERTLGASVPVRRHECALAAVTPPRRALDVSRDIARRGRSIRPRTDRASRSRFLRRPHLGAFHFLEEQLERAFHDRARVPVRDLAAEKGLQAPESVVALLADRELDTVALRRGVLDDRTACRRVRRWTGDRSRIGGIGRGRRRRLCRSWHRGDWHRVHRQRSYRCRSAARWATSSTDASRSLPASAAMRSRRS